MAQGLAEPLSTKGGLAGTAPHGGSGDLVPTPNPSKPQRDYSCCFPPQKRHQRTPGNIQNLQPAAGDTLSTSLSPCREWGRPSLTPRVMERDCLQAGQGGFVAGQPRCGAPPKIPSLLQSVDPISPTWPPQGLASSRMWRLGWAGLAAGVLFSFLKMSRVLSMPGPRSPVGTVIAADQHRHATVLILPLSLTAVSGSTGPRDGDRVPK